MILNSLTTQFNKIRSIFSHVEKEKKGKLTIVFANYDYLPVLENWLYAMQRIGVDNFLIIALDKKLYDHLQNKNINSRLYPCELDLGKLWIHRIEVILKLLKEGYDIIHSDADAIWLQDPLPYLDSLPHDMIFSQGTVWPPDVHEAWNFVLCCGFFMIRSNKDTLKFIHTLLQQVKKDKDDQRSCNRLLLDMQTTWEEPLEPYLLNFKGKQFTCSAFLRTGKCANMTLALLPHKKFQRIYEETDAIYIRHLISEKNSDHIVDVLQNSGCWFVQ